mmetsp:Transcript_56237/g.180543  ORF Transcript_56237/g.180543 Transcript_56237/m.180543 type:complete len:228 (-) Transcript_56237:913-1596(-)
MPPWRLRRMEVERPRSSPIPRGEVSSSSRTARAVLEEPAPLLEASSWSCGASRISRERTWRRRMAAPLPEARPGTPVAQCSQKGTSASNARSCAKRPPSLEALRGKAGRSTCLPRNCEGTVPRSLLDTRAWKATETGAPGSSCLDPLWPARSCAWKSLPEGMRFMEGVRSRSRRASDDVEVAVLTPLPALPALLLLLPALAVLLPFSPLPTAAAPRPVALTAARGSQ